jgi:hypothetical protein
MRNAEEILLRTVFRLLVTANTVPSSPILVILMMEAILSSESSVLTTAAIPEDGILHSHCRKNLGSYIALTSWALWRRRNVSCEVRTRFLYPRRRNF